MLEPAVAAPLFLFIGAVLLAVGIRRRRAHNRWNRRDDDRLLHPGDNEDPVRPSQPSGRGTVFIVAGIPMLLLGASHVLAYLAAWREPSAASKLEVRQCIRADAYSDGQMDVEAMDCDHPDATPQLAAEGDSTATCPDGNREGGLYPVIARDSGTQCFVLNLKEGGCYAVARTAVPVDCTDPSANVKVVSRVDGSAEEAACGADAEVLAHRQPSRAFCLVVP